MLHWGKRTDSKNNRSVNGADSNLTLATPLPDSQWKSIDRRETMSAPHSDNQIKHLRHQDLNSGTSEASVKNIHSDPYFSSSFLLTFSG